MKNEPIFRFWSYVFVVAVAALILVFVLPLHSAILVAHILVSYLAFVIGRWLGWRRGREGRNL